MKNLFCFLALFFTSLLFAQDPAGALYSFNNAITTIDPDPRIHDFVIQPDGKIILAGDFGINNNAINHIIRLNADGSIDTSFNTGTGFNYYNGTVYKIILQPDGKILAAGLFSSYNGVAINKIARLNTDGTLDISFDPGQSFDGNVNTIKLLENGKIMVGGAFYNFNGQPVKKLARLNADGSFDASFINGFTGDDEYVTIIETQPDGKILVGGNFQYYSGVMARRFMRLHPDGSLDTTFSVGEYGFGPEPPYDVKMQPDGKIIVCGSFNYLNGEQARKLVRLNEDGTKDTNFQLFNFSESAFVRSIALKPNGKIVVGGDFLFTGFNGGIENITIMNPDGTIDESFTPSFGQYSLGDGVYTLELMPDGHILAGGYFSYYENTPVKSYLKLRGTDYYRFQGTVKVDYDNNGCSDTDYGYSHMKFHVVNGLVTSDYYGTQSGIYDVYLKNGTNTITLQPEHPEYFTVSPQTATITFPGAAQPYIQDFCLTPNGVHPDVAVSVIPLNVARPGFESQYKIIYQNNGNTVESGTVALSFNEPILEYASATPAVSTQSSGSLSWNYSNLGPMQKGSIIVSFIVNTPTATPPVTAGDILSYTATITSQNNDEIPVDNTFTLNQEVVNSFDPNDKTCLEGSNVTTLAVGNYVHYLIRFENTGNYPAQDITIKDIIDTTKFDIATLQPLDGSHSFITRITEGNVAEFIFQNIQLPFEDETNDGYVSFKIKTLPTLVVGDSFSNTASIFFDYNEPIITNTATTEIQVLQTDDFRFEDAFKIYPNPAKDVLEIESTQNKNINRISIYNTISQLIMAIPTNSATQSLNISGLNQGTYIMKIETDMGVFSVKFIKM